MTSKDGSFFFINLSLRLHEAGKIFVPSRLGEMQIVQGGILT